jgi:hypothetical protein
VTAIAPNAPGTGGRPTSSKAERRAARADHEQELARLIDRVREGLARFDGGEIDAFELDRVTS